MFFIGSYISDKSINDIICKIIGDFNIVSNFKHFVYSSYNEMFKNYPHNLDLLILELDIYNLDYLSILSTINKIDKHVHILIISKSSTEYNTIYNIKNITYMFNITNKDIFISFLKSLLKKSNKSNSNTLTFTKKNQLVKIDFESISYIETETHTRSLIIYYENKSHKIKSSISQIENKLNSKLFFRCHKSYIINVDKIIKIDNRLAYLDDGNYIPIGRDNVKELKFILHSFNTT